MFQSLNVKYRKKFKSDLKQKEKILTTMIVLRVDEIFPASLNRNFFFPPLFKKVRKRQSKIFFLVSGIVMELKK